MQVVDRYLAGEQLPNERWKTIEFCVFPWNIPDFRNQHEQYVSI